MNNWKRNLVIVWLSQFVSIMGFSFALPFAPFYIQELGVTDANEVKMMTSLFASMCPLSLAIFSPIWGMIADRYGRKPMLLRAYFGGAVVLALMGMTSSVWVLIALRFCQGIFTGTITASQALIASGTPEHRSGLALGSLTSAVYSGSMAGTLCGGWVADHFGYRAAFATSGGFLLICALMVQFGVRESFTRPDSPKHGGESGASSGGVLSLWSVAAPILILFFGMSITRQFDLAFFPLWVQHLHGGLDGVASKTGLILGGCGIAGILSGFAAGYLSDRMSATRIAVWTSVAAALFLIPQGWVSGLGTLFLLRFPMVLFAGAMGPVLQTWLTRSTPAHSRGIVFGWSTTAQSIAWMISPLIAGAVACVGGIPWVFYVGGISFFMMIPLIHWAERRSLKKHYGHPV